MKKIFLFIFLIIIILNFCGCAIYANKIPRIELVRSNSAYDAISIPLRNGYNYAENIYSIEDTEEGYNIIIHCIKE